MPVWDRCGMFEARARQFLLAALFSAVLLSAFSRTARAQESGPQQPPVAAQTQPQKPHWLFGGFLDLGYLLDFNHPANHSFRSRGTTRRTDQLELNMAAVYLKKEISDNSSWGVELTFQTGGDSEIFGYSATAPNFPGSRALRHLGPTNLSYRIPAGKGLTVQGGYFSSLIGYDSLYARDNFNYTRPWGADFTPYLMFGVNAAYPFTDRLTGTFFVINGYWHLANANSVPSFGSQLAFTLSDRHTLRETLLLGPHQSNTALQYWRFLSDTISEWKAGRLTLAIEYMISSERVNTAGRPRALWMAAQLPARWTFNNHWSVALRPEVTWDRDGRWTSFRQTVKAVTTTLEYRVPYWRTNTILRLEHRWDDSRGPEGGFFRDGEISPGVIALTPSQHLLVFGVMVSLDSSRRP